MSYSKLNSESCNQGFQATKQDGRLLDQLQDLPISLKTDLIKGRDVLLTLVFKKGPTEPGTGRNLTRACFFGSHGTICTVSTREVGTQPCSTRDQTLVGSSTTQVLNHCAISASAPIASRSTSSKFKKSSYFSHILPHHPQAP